MTQARACSTTRSFSITSQLPPPTNDACDALGPGYLAGVPGGCAFESQVIIGERGVHL